MKISKSFTMQIELTDRVSVRIDVSPVTGADRVGRTVTVLCTECGWQRIDPLGALRELAQAHEFDHTIAQKVEVGQTWFVECHECLDFDRFDTEDAAREHRRNHIGLFHDDIPMPEMTP